ESYKTLFYWSIPTRTCIKKNISINPQNYGIITNTNETFHGDKIVILYEKDVGLYPYYKKINESYYEPVNGGIPQRVNYTAHLEVLSKNISKIIPNISYDGLAILDLERWRIVYETNWNEQAIHKNESIKYVQSLNSSLKDEEAKGLAKANFTDAAFNFFKETIKQCKKLRPNATWGFYDLMLCNEKGNKNGAYC
uniref:Hyaluronidase n=1 Tax=Parastrongyloides trichosuri TaxID=131310 RepID=A0A0N4ZA96_PARTI